jgi:hypothetical protein
LITEVTTFKAVYFSLAYVDLWSQHREAALKGKGLELEGEVEGPPEGIESACSALPSIILTICVAL